MTKAEATEKASDFARQRGYDPTQYAARAEKEDDLWVIHFQSKSDKPRPGDFFTVYIDDKSGAVQRIFYGK